MIQLVDSHNLQPNSSIDEEILNNLYSFLRPSVSRLVYFSNIPAFQGQEYDLIQDIIQEAIVKFTFYSQETYVFFPKQMVLVIAKRLFLDTVRKESRIEHSIPEIF